MREQEKKNINLQYKVKPSAENTIDMKENNGVKNLDEGGWP